jgi:hypothetical protein
MPYRDYRPVDLLITPSDAAYTANDVVGGVLSFTMNNATGFLYGVTVTVGEASIAVPGTIWFYSAVPTTTIADNAAFAPVHADNKKILGKVLLPTADALNSFNVYITLLTTPMPFTCTGTLYAYFVTSGTPNFTGAAQEIQIRLHVYCEG